MPTYRRIAMRFPYLTETEIVTEIETMMRQARRRQNILIAPRPAAALATINRDAILGLIPDYSTLAHQLPDDWDVSLTVEERL